MAICKTGAEHLASLKDGRTVYIDGDLVSDATTHRAFRSPVASAASLYDFQAAPENLELMTFAPEGGNRRINRAWDLPRSHAEMVSRRRGLTAVAGGSYGFMGSSPESMWL